MSITRTSHFLNITKKINCEWDLKINWSVVNNSTSGKISVEFVSQPNIYVSWSTSELGVRLACRETGLSPTVKYCRRYIFCGSSVLFMSCACNAYASVHCCLVVTWRERADLMALVCDVYCVFVTFPLGILGRVWYLIISIPDPCYSVSFPRLGKCFRCCLCRLHIHNRKAMR